MWRLIQPLDYLRISHPEKRLFDVWLPLLVGVILSMAWLSPSFQADVFKPAGFLSQIQNLLAILTGFFIAALAAVATFDNKGMDLAMPGKIKVTLLRKSDQSQEILTRRRFLCLLFGYLAFLALMLYLTGVLANTFHLNIGTWIDFFLTTQPRIKNLAMWVIWFIYCSAFSQLLINTLLGLFYLTDRIHREDGRRDVGNPTIENARNEAVLPAE